MSNAQTIQVGEESKLLEDFIFNINKYTVVQLSQFKKQFKFSVSGRPNKEAFVKILRERAEERISTIKNFSSHQQQGEVNQEFNCSADISSPLSPITQVTGDNLNFDIIISWGYLPIKLQESHHFTRKALDKGPEMSFSHVDKDSVREYRKQDGTQTKITGLCLPQMSKTKPKYHIRLDVMY
jgi:hypothetical protein